MSRKLVTRFRLFLKGLYYPPLREEYYVTESAGRDIQLFHSCFNTKWLACMKIEPAVIIELGSFDGGDAMRFSQDFPGCRIVTVEADPERLSIVQENLAGAPVEVLPYAVCDQDGSVEWYSATMDGDVHGQGSMYAHTDSYKKSFPSVKQTNEPAKVDSVRLDTLCSDLGIAEIDLLHMDIEGAEHAALSGLGALRPKVIFLETADNRFEGGHGVDETHRLLEQLGYELVIDLDLDRLYLHKAAKNSPSVGKRAA